VTNPFDDPDGNYTVLANAEGQHCLWPSSVDTPAGWNVVHGPASRRTCLDYVNVSWTDLRPRSVVVAMDGNS
jgi:MbtH protein